MDKRDAEEILHAVDEASASLNRGLFVAQKCYTNEQLAKAKTEVGRMLVNLQLTVLGPVYEAFPDLDKHGYFRKGKGAP